MKTNTKLDKKASADPTLPPLVPVTRGEIAEAVRNTSSSSSRVTRASSRVLSSHSQTRSHHHSEFSSGVANPGLASSVTASSSRHSSPTPPTSISGFSRASSATTFSSLPTIAESPKAASVTEAGLRRSTRTRTRTRTHTRSRATSTQPPQEPTPETAPEVAEVSRPTQSAEAPENPKESQSPEETKEPEVEVAPEPSKALASSKDHQPILDAPEPFEIFGPSKKKAASPEKATSSYEWAHAPKKQKPKSKPAHLQPSRFEHSPERENPELTYQTSGFQVPLLEEGHPLAFSFFDPLPPPPSELGSQNYRSAEPQDQTGFYGEDESTSSFFPHQSRQSGHNRVAEASSYYYYYPFIETAEERSERIRLRNTADSLRIIQAYSNSPYSHGFPVPEYPAEDLTNSPQPSPTEPKQTSPQPCPYPHDHPVSESQEESSRDPPQRSRTEPEQTSSKRSCTEPEQTSSKRSRADSSRDISTGISRATNLEDSDLEDNLPGHSDPPRYDWGPRLAPKSRLKHSEKEVHAHTSLPLPPLVAQQRGPTVPKIRSSLRVVQTISSDTESIGNTYTPINKKKHQRFIMSEAEKEAYDEFRHTLGLPRPERLGEPTVWYSRSAAAVNGTNGAQNMSTGSVNQPSTMLYPIPSTIEERYDPSETMVCLNCDIRIGRDEIGKHLASCVAGNDTDEETRSSLSEPPISPATSRRRSMPLGNLENLPGPYDDDASDSESVSSADDTNAAEILLNMKFHKITKIEKFAQTLQNIDQMDHATLHARIHNAQRAMVTYQDEWMALERMTAKAAAGDGIPVLRNPRKVRDYHQYQDRLEADLYGYEHDSHHAKVGMQDPLAQREGGRGANGRNLRHRMPTQKAAEADLSASPESMATGEDNGRRLTRSRYGSSRPNSQSREESPHPVSTFLSGKRKGRPPKNASRVEELRASKSAHSASRKNVTKSPSALSKYETPDGSEDDTEPDDMESSPRKQQRGRKGGKAVDVREAVRRAQSSKAADSVESNDDYDGSNPADESRPTSSSSGRSSSLRANSTVPDALKRKSAEPDDGVERPAKKPRNRRSKQAPTVEEDETDSNAVDTGADDTDATSGKAKKGGKPKSTHLSNVQKGKWAEDDGTRKAKQSTSMKLRWAKHAVLKKYGHNQGNTLTGVHANMVMPTPEMQAEVEELIKAELAKAETEYADKGAQSQAALSPTSSLHNVQSAPQQVAGSSRPTPQQSVDPENAAQPAAKPRPKKMVTLADGTVVTAQSKVMRDRWEKKRAAIAAGLPVPQIGRYPAGSQANSASATPRAASQSASSVAASRKPTPDSSTAAAAAAANAAASEEITTASEPKKAGKGKRKRKEEPVEEPTAAEVLESVEQAAAPPSKKARGGRPPKNNVTEEVADQTAAVAASQAPASSAAPASEASATSSRIKRAPKPKVPFGEETPILPPGTTLPASSGKRKRTEETPILPPAAVSAPKKKLGRPRKNTQSEDAPPEEISSASKRRKTSSATAAARTDGTSSNVEQSAPANGSGTNPAVRKSSRPRRQRNMGLDGADDSSDEEEQPRKMSEYEQFLALTSPALNSPLGPRGKRPAALRASTSFVLPDTSSEADEDEEEDAGEESPREEQAEGEGLQQELARQFKSEYDQFQAISSPGANIVLGKRNRKSVLSFGDVKREGSGSQGSQSPFRN